MLFIEKWTPCALLKGYANNILQIIRAIHYCFVYKHNRILMLEHRYLNTKEILINEIKDDKNEIISDTFFYFQEKLEPKLMKEYYQKYIKNIIKFNLENIEMNNNDLFIHIRSGDLFSNVHPHRAYVQPPMFYYKKIIERYDKINIIYEDDKNPCVNELGKLDNVNMMSVDLENTFREFMKAKYLAIGFGTFGLLLYIMNPNLEKLYMPEYVYNEMPKGDYDLNLELIDLPNYIKCGEWNCSKEQLELMINYR